MRFPERHKPLLEGAARNCRLELAVGQARTVERRFSNGYLSVSKPLYPEGDLPHFILINTAGGLVQGDRLSVGVAVRDGCRAHLTTQSASRIYRMEDGCAVQETNLSAGENAFLEYLPDPNIPFKGSNGFQLTTVDLRPTSTFFGWDAVHPGRYACGEKFEMGVYHSALELRIGGRPALVDTIVLEPGKLDHAVPGIAAGASFIATIYVYCADVEALGKSLGASCCVNHAGVLVIRLLGDDWLIVQKTMKRIHDRFREHMRMPPLISRRG